jgi:hypothetical protein
MEDEAVKNNNLAFTVNTSSDNIKFRASRTIVGSGQDAIWPA